MRRRLWVIGVACALPLWPLLAASPAAVLEAGGTVLLGRFSVLACLGLTLHLGLLAVLVAVWLREPSPRALKRAGFGALALLLALGLALGVGELLLRLRAEHLPRSLTRYLGAPPFRLSESSHYLYDGPWRFRGKPDLRLPPAPAEGEFVREGRLRQHPLAEAPEEVGIELDGDGFRNPAVPEQVDVVCVGDSFTFGWNLPREASWPALLAERTGRSVYSLAVNAYSPSQERLVLEGFGLPKHPRLVVWALFEGNDVQDEAGFQAAAGRPAGQAAPPASLQGSHLVALARWLGDGLPRGLVDHALAPQEAPVGEVGGVELPLAVGDAYLRNLYRPAESWAAEPGLAAIRATLEQGRDACAAAGAELLVLVIPSKAHALLPLLTAEERGRVYAQTLRGEYAALRGARPAGVGAADWEREVAARIDARREAGQDALCEALVAALDAAGIAHLELLEPLRAAYLAGRAPYFALDSHWNRTGHEVAADAVAAWLERRPR
ncbi:MAG: hypothetical protein R3F62_15420 [Planctomycetota bacterium]